MNRKVYTGIFQIEILGHMKFEETGNFSIVSYVFIP